MADSKALQELTTGFLLLSNPVGGTVAFSPDGKLLAAQSTYYLHVWDSASGTPMHSLPASTTVRDFAFSPDGRLLAVGNNYNDKIDFWDVASWSIKETLTAHPWPPVIWILHTSVTCVSFSPDGKLLASADNEKTIRLWRVPQ